MRRPLWLAVLLTLVLGWEAWAEPVPLTIWQKEKRYRPSQGQIIRLQKGPFTALLPLSKGESVALAAMACPLPASLTAFNEGTGMAGPYDGLYLTPDAHHYFYLDDQSDDQRTGAWDPGQHIRYWKPSKLYDNTDSPAVEIPWEKAPNLTLIVRKEGFDDLIFYIVWQ